MDDPTLDELVTIYDDIRIQIDQLENRKKVIAASILQKMSEKTMTVGPFIVRRYRYISVKLSLEEARAINAVKMEEVVDRKKIKALFQLGQPILGVSEVESLRVSNLKERVQELG